MVLHRPVETTLLGSAGVRGQCRSASLQCSLEENGTTAKTTKVGYLPAWDDREPDLATQSFLLVEMTGSNCGLCVLYTFHWEHNNGIRQGWIQFVQRILHVGANARLDNV